MKLTNHVPLLQQMLHPYFSHNWPSCVRVESVNVQTLTDSEKGQQLTTSD